MIVPDLNLLVYAHSTGAPLHKPARRWWEDLVNGTERVGVPWLVAAGFVRLLTHPSVLNTPAAPEHAVDLMAEWFRSPSVTPLNPGTQHIAIFRNMLAAAGVGGEPRYRRPHRRAGHRAPGRGPLQRQRLRALPGTALAQPAMTRTAPTS